MKMIMFGLAALVVAGCSSTAAAPDAGPKFDDEAQAEITCLRHQQAAPGTRYLDEANWDTDVTLPLMRYYTSNGGKAYCDGQGPTDVDQAWLEIYVKLGADQENVKSLLTPSAPAPTGSR